jgi:hypothetical protein
MQRVNETTIRLGPLSLLVGLTFWITTAASAQLMVRLSFDQLVEKSDHIFIADCVKKEVVFIQGRIITRYCLKPTEFLKGSPRLNQAGEIEMEELGGDLPGPVPVSQVTPIMANFQEGEEILLFTHDPMLRKEKGKTPVRMRSAISPQSLRIMGGTQGRFSVLRHPETGRKMVSRSKGSALAGNSPEMTLMRQVDRVRATAATMTDGSTSVTSTRVRATKTMSKMRQMGKRVDKTRARAKASRDAIAQTNPDQGDDIYRYEPLDSVKSRVSRAMTRRANP